MSWSSTSPWGKSYYATDVSYYDSASWKSSNYTQNEQYNPAYPSLNGSSGFFSSSQQQYTAPPYNPSRDSRGRGSSTQQKTGRGTDWRRSNKAWPANNFHLIQINPDSSVSKLDVPKPKEPAPKPVVKVARANNRNVISQRGGRGIQKMPHYRLQGNGWETNGYPNQAGYGSRGGARGGRGSSFPGRGGRFHGHSKPANSKDDIEYVHLPEEAPAITLSVSSDNIVAFHGFDSVFTTQHCFPVLIDGKIYTSCDHFYQIRKVLDLTGASSDSLNKGVRDESGKLIVESSDKEKRAHSAIAKDLIKASKVSKETVEKWRNTKGLEAIQTALHAKVTQSAHLREALKESGDQILVHAFPRDSIYGTGCNVPAIKSWLDGLEKSGVKSLRIPATFPLDEKTVQHCPSFAQGRNVLGVILMQLREKVRNGDLEVVDMTNIYNSLRVNNNPAEKMDTSSTSGLLAATNSAGTF